MSGTGIGRRRAAWELLKELSKWPGALLIVLLSLVSLSIRLCFGIIRVRPDGRAKYRPSKSLKTRFGRKRKI